jgi:sugar phosphate isomerase/epimerase
MATRRVFIQHLGLMAGGLLVNPQLTFSKTFNKVGIQLYTLRNELSKDAKSVIVKVAELGFKEVETFGYSKQRGFWGMDARAFKTLLQANKITSPSGHYGFDLFLNEGKEDDLKDNIEAANILGQSYLTVPYFNPAKLDSLDKYKEIAEKLNRAATLCKEAGLQLAYHNHDFEFKDWNGTTGYDILLKDTDPSALKFELDLYWAVRAGKDPIKLFQENPGRFAMWHVKDMNKVTKDFTEVGTGSIDFKKIFEKASLAGVKHIFVEQDKITIDPYVSVKTSIDYIRQTLI